VVYELDDEPCRFAPRRVLSSQSLTNEKSVLKLFPEVRPDRGFGWDSDNSEDGSPPPETQNGADGDDSALLTREDENSHKCPKSSPRRSQSEPRLRRARRLSYQQVTSISGDRNVQVNFDFGPTPGRIGVGQAQTGSYEIGPVRPIFTGLWRSQSCPCHTGASLVG